MDINKLYRKVSVVHSYYLYDSESFIQFLPRTISKKMMMPFDTCEGEQPLEVLTYCRDQRPSSLCSQTLGCPLSINVKAEV